MRTLQTSFLKSFFTFSLIISPLSFAENPLLTQAKILQTGSPTVLINTDKAIQLLQQASDQGDAEAYFYLRSIILIQQIIGFYLKIIIYIKNYA